jgi:hypothetical protein
LEEHESLSIYFANTHRQALEEVAVGQPASAALRLAIAGLKNTPLDESPGEGFHRSTHHVKARCAHAKLPFVKSSLRLKQNLKRVRAVARTRGLAGQAAVRFEWRRYKRVLQHRAWCQWRPVRMSDGDFYRRLYRMDSKALDDFSVVAEQPGSSPSDRAPLAMTENSQLEYIECVVAIGCYYSIAVPAFGPHGPADEAVVDEIVYFNVIDRHGKRSRLVLVPTFDSKDEVTLRAPLAFLVQYFGVWRSDPGRGVTVFADSDPQWLPYTEIGSFHNVQATLLTWQCRASDTDCCIDLFGAAPARPTVPLEDAACPSLTICSALVERGWAPVFQTVVHRAVEPMRKQFDGRDPVGRKPYLQVVVSLDRFITLTSTIPSDQPLMFYRLLLLGQRVEPGLGHVEYKRIMSVVDGTHDDKVPALGDGSANMALVDDSDDGEVLVAGGVAPIEDARSGQTARAGVRARRRAPDSDTVSSDGRAAVCDGASSTSSSRSTSDDESSVSTKSSSASTDSAIVVGGVSSTATKWYMLEGGGKLKCERYTPKDKPTYVRWILRCPDHDHCFKKRSVSARTCARHGRLEPVAYLLAWLQMRVPDGHKHNQLAPAAALVDASAEGHARFFDDHVVATDSDVVR